MKTYDRTQHYMFFYDLNYGQNLIIDLVEDIECNYVSIN